MEHDEVPVRAIDPGPTTAPVPAAGGVRRLVVGAVTLVDHP
jgi:hypothetical protein